MYVLYISGYACVIVYVHICVNASVIIWICDMYVFVYVCLCVVSGYVSLC